jgi:hypothetical protein
MVGKRYDPFHGATDLVERMAIAMSLADEPPIEGTFSERYRMMARAALDAIDASGLMLTPKVWTEV